MFFATKHLLSDHLLISTVTVGSGGGGWKVFFATKQTLLCTLMSWSDQPSMSKHPKKRKSGLWKGRHWKEWLPGPILCTLLSWSELWRWTLNTAPDQIHLSKSIVHQMHLCSRMNAIRCLLDLVQWSSHFNFQRGFRLQTKGFFSSISGVLIIVIGSMDCHDMEKVHLLENCWTDKQFWLRSFVKKLWRWQRGRFQSSLDITASYKREATSNIFNIQHIRMAAPNPFLLVLSVSLEWISLYF